MKRRRKQIIRVEARILDIQREWKSLVSSYAADARHELGKIYAQLTHTNVPPDARVPPYVLGTESVLANASQDFIYYVNDVLCYGTRAQKRYPVEDTSLWPWTARARPLGRMTKDVLYLICAHLTLNDIWRTLRRVCKQWRAWIGHNHGVRLRLSKHPALAQMYDYMECTIGRQYALPPVYSIPKNTHDAIRFFNALPANHQSIILAIAFAFPHKILGITRYFDADTKRLHVSIRFHTLFVRASREYMSIFHWDNDICFNVYLEHDLCGRSSNIKHILARYNSIVQFKTRTGFCVDQRFIHHR